MTNTWATPARGPSRSPAGPTAVTISISAPTPAAAARTTSAAAACLSANYEYVGYSGTGTFTQTGGTHTIAAALYLGANAGSSGTYNLSGSGLFSAASEYVGLRPGRYGLLPADRRHEHGLGPVDRQRRHVSAGGRHLAGQRQSRQPGNLRRQRHAGTARRQQPFGPVQRHLAEPGRAFGEHGPQFALDRACRIQPIDGLRPLQQPGFDPHPRHHAHGARRAGLWRFGLDRRSGRIAKGRSLPPPAARSTSAEG